MREIRGAADGLIGVGGVNYNRTIDAMTLYVKRGSQRNRRGVAVTTTVTSIYLSLCRMTLLCDGGIVSDDLLLRPLCETGTCR